MGRLDGKVAIISGGARGQGAAETALFVKEGAKVVFGDVLDEEGRKLEAQIGELGREVTYLHLNVINEEDWQGAVELAEAKYGRLNILVNNAGISRTHDLEDISTQDWDEIMDVNAKGVFLGTKYAIPAMRRASRGSIINISSHRRHSRSQASVPCLQCVQRCCPGVHQSDCRSVCKIQHQV